jgi:hypothetical protein
VCLWGAETEFVSLQHWSHCDANVVNDDSANISLGCMHTDATMRAGGRPTLDFTSWEATRQLTASLLACDFSVRWWLPEGQLIPTLTNRANYIHWINDLLQLSKPPGAVNLNGFGAAAWWVWPLRENWQGLHTRRGAQLCML